VAGGAGEHEENSKSSIEIDMTLFALQPPPETLEPIDEYIETQPE
jgi:hypothetical protein